MKYAYSILTIFFLSFIFLGSCTQGEIQVGKENAPLKFELNVKGGIPVTRSVEVPFKAFVFIYKVTSPSAPAIRLEGEFNDAKAILYSTPTNNFIRSAAYNIFTVATADVALQEKLNTDIAQTDLLDLIQSKSELGKDGHLFAGGLRGVTFINPSKLIYLLRNICQLKLTVTDETAGKYKSITAFFVAPDKTYIFPSDARGSIGIPSDAVDASNEITFLKNDKVYTGSCYFFEKNDGLTLKIKAVRDGDAGEETLNYELALEKTERNTIYQVNAELKLTEITITSTSIDWSGTIDDPQEIIPE